MQEGRVLHPSLDLAISILSDVSAAAAVYKVFLTGLCWDVDALLALHLDRHRDAFLGGNVLADLLTLVPAMAALQVHNPKHWSF